jgi:hypothetical protein
LGLSAVTKLSPAKIVGFSKNFGFFLATASSNCTILANIASVDFKWYSARFEFSKTELLSPFEYLFYRTWFRITTVSTFASNKKLMHGVDKELNN